jgi:hypothetical protein
MLALREKKRQRREDKRASKHGRVGAQMHSGFGIRIMPQTINHSFNSAFYHATNGLTKYTEDTTQLQVKGVGTDPAARQSLIVQKVKYEYDDTIRAKSADRTWESNWNPSIEDRAGAFVALRHLAVFSQVQVDAPASYNLGGEPSVLGFCSMTNLIKDFQYRLVGFAENPGKPRGNGDQQDLYNPNGTAATLGLLTVVNFGKESIRAGDKIIYTPESYTIEKDGKRVAKFVVKDITEEFLPAQCFPMHTRHIATTLCMLYRESKDYFEILWSDPMGWSNTYQQKLSQYRELLGNQWLKFQPFYYHALFHTLAVLFDKLVLWYMHELLVPGDSSTIITNLKSMVQSTYTAGGLSLVEYYRKVIFGGSNWDAMVKSHQWIQETEARAPIPMRHPFRGDQDLAGLGNRIASAKEFAQLEPTWMYLSNMQGYLFKAVSSTRNECQDLIDRYYGGEAQSDAEPGGDFDLLIRATV